MYMIHEFALKTVTGDEVKVKIRGYERLEGPHAVVEVNDRIGEFTGGVAHPVPSEEPEPQSWYKGLYELGASHYARIHGIGDLPLDAEQAAFLTTTFEDAKRRCKEHRRRADEERAAEIRKAHDVKRVLRWSPACTESIFDAEWVLEEAYPINASEEVTILIWSALPLCAAAVKLDCRCPSLASVVERSSFCGSMFGHQNTLFLISSEDWNLLVVENDVIVEQRDAEMRERNVQYGVGTERSRALTNQSDAVTA